jgi:hypothetical protein
MAKPQVDSSQAAQMAPLLPENDIILAAGERQP